jgi:hypothetical protein
MRWTDNAGDAFWLGARWAGLAAPPPQDRIGKSDFSHIDLDEGCQTRELQDPAIQHPSERPGVSAFQSGDVINFGPKLVASGIWTVARIPSHRNSSFSIFEKIL